MFDEQHYVPVLRWKRGEQTALRNLLPNVRSRLTPIIEPTPRQFEDWDTSQREVLDVGLQRAAEAIGRSWGVTPCFFDVHLISRLRGMGGKHPAAIIAEVAADQGLRIVPVVTLNASRSHREAVSRSVKNQGLGCAIRITLDGRGQAPVAEALETLRGEIGVEPKDGDLLLDLQLIRETPADLYRVLRAIPRLSEWRTLTALGGSFPKDLTGMSIGDHLCPRLEWRWWRRQTNSKGQAPRKPTFGDYTTQHALFNEPPKGASFSASVRYTLDEDWLVMRGESVFKPDGPGYHQWPAHAQLLCKRSEYCGRNFSPGDGYIFERAHNPEKTGNAESWLSAGVSHHMTFVTSQIASLREGGAAA